MGKRDIVEEMNEYYRVRAPWHDAYMSYSGNAGMEQLLRPIVDLVEPLVEGRDVLEVACGTGNWTQVLARRARSVLATDINESMVAIARDKAYEGGRVAFTVADAYTLAGVDGSFSAAFAADWWSHVPVSRVPGFLKTLHGRLLPGSSVIFVDMMYREHPDFTPYRQDEEGNCIRRRRLPDGQEYDVLRNFPSQAQLLGFLEGIGREVEYWEDGDLLRWVVIYRTA